MKGELSATCPVCGFGHPLKKFSCQPQPIEFPVQIVSGVGRTLDFKVQQYLPWSSLPVMKVTEAWTSILSIYGRLGAAYDNYYEFLVFLSPKVHALLQQYKSYADAYSVNATTEYHRIYSSATLNDFVESHNHEDCTDAYAHLLPTGGVTYE